MRHVEVCMLLVAIPLHSIACRNILFFILTHGQLFFAHLAIAHMHRFKLLKMSSSVVTINDLKIREQR
jgi:hypothetical protein